MRESMSVRRRARKITGVDARIQSSPRLRDLSWSGLGTCTKERLIRPKLLFLKDF